MDRWEWTKVGASVVLAVGVALVGDWFAGQVVDVQYPERQGYPIEGVAPVDLAAAQRSWPGGLSQPGDEAKLRGYMAHIEKAVLPLPATGIAAPVAAAPVDLGTLLASADPERGKGTAKLCASCHTFDQGGAQPGRAQSVGGRRPRYRRQGRLRLLVGDCRPRRRLDLSGIGPLSDQPGAGDPRQQNGLQRRQEPEGSCQSPRLSQHAWSRASALSGTQAGRSGTRTRQDHFLREVAPRKQ